MKYLYLFCISARFNTYTYLEDRKTTNGRLQYKHQNRFFGTVDYLQAEVQHIQRIISKDHMVKIVKFIC